ncbi:uncharacterized protein EV422DRAFT_535093 [Fimicolochytrium jonesii]|uniref:uncharacterized protein n=1 Tax=Fimicolochytrium jonesii TaxID=1396493 RepID=UPI0022FE478B|nr:uncharacterized protein EV422DRAFT_535093 [Fimicolochytrium jonesii]KAI8819095.1 hypothetical protein EV422DRAFT_535093 [Fimicolochytrium jonesii]
MGRTTATLVASLNAIAFLAGLFFLAVAAELTFTQDVFHYNLPQWPSDAGSGIVVVGAGINKFIKIGFWVVGVILILSSITGIAFLMYRRRRIDYSAIAFNIHSIFSTLAGTVTLGALVGAILAIVRAGDIPDTTNPSGGSTSAKTRFILLAIITGAMFLIVEVAYFAARRRHKTQLSRKQGMIVANNSEINTGLPPVSVSDGAYYGAGARPQPLPPGIDSIGANGVPKMSKKTDDDLDTVTQGVYRQQRQNYSKPYYPPVPAVAERPDYAYVSPHDHMAGYAPAHHDTAYYAPSTAMGYSAPAAAAVPLAGGAAYASYAAHQHQQPYDTPYHQQQQQTYNHQTTAYPDYDYNSGSERYDHPYPHLLSQPQAASPPRSQDAPTALDGSYTADNNNNHEASRTKQAYDNTTPAADHHSAYADNTYYRADPSGEYPCGASPPLPPSSSAQQHVGGYYDDESVSYGYGNRRDTLGFEARAMAKASAVGTETENSAVSAYAGSFYQVPPPGTMPPGR